MSREASNLSIPRKIPSYITKRPHRPHVKVRIDHDGDDSGSDSDNTASITDNRRSRSSSRQMKQGVQSLHASTVPSVDSSSYMDVLTPLDATALLRVTSLSRQGHPSLACRQYLIETHPLFAAQLVNNESINDVSSTRKTEIPRELAQLMTDKVEDMEDMCGLGHCGVDAPTQWYAASRLYSDVTEEDVGDL
jgi:hypothetical protein